MKWTLIIAAAAPVVLACPVFAQTDPALKHKGLAC